MRCLQAEEQKEPSRQGGRRTNVERPWGPMVWRKTRGEAGRWIMEGLLKKRSLDSIREDGDVVKFTF